MKILYARTQFWFNLKSGGSVGHTIGVLSGFKQNDCQLKVVSNEKFLGINSFDYSIIEPKIKKPAFLGELFYNFYAGKKFKKEILKFKPDFIYHRYTNYTFFVAKIAKKINIPLVLEFNSFGTWQFTYWGNKRSFWKIFFKKYLLYPIIERIEDYNLDNADLIVVVSKPLKEDLLKLGIPEEKILVNPNGVDLEKFNPKINKSNKTKVLKNKLIISRDKIIIGFSGTFGSWHGVLQLAEAIDEINRKKSVFSNDIVFLLIGDGPLKKEVERKIGHYANVIFTGEIPYSEIQYYLAVCDILVSPHCFQADKKNFFGSPTKIFEYMAMNKAIIASNLGQIGEVLSKKTAILVQPENIKELVRAILELSRNKQLRNRLSINARKEVIQKYTWKENTRKILGILNSKKFINREEIINILKKSFPKKSKEITQEGKDFLRHNFDLLGSGKINLGPKINWHCDFKSNYCWNSKIPSCKIKYGDKEGVDVKVPWELSRFQHLIALGQAYWLTKDERYTKEFVRQIKDWTKENPVGYGVNWKCTMDVAIRACNWIKGFYFFQNSKKISSEFINEFSNNLFSHGKYIEKNLEKSWKSFSSNHYLSDVVGLVYLGVFFKNTKKGQKWLNFGIKELKKEMKKQVYSDGCDFEASTYYHRLVLELFFFSTLLVAVNNENSEKIFGREYTERLYKMFEALLYLLKPNGKMPQIGDNDNGRLHIFGGREISDMRYLLTMGAIFFQDPRFKIKEFGFNQEALWVFGRKGYDAWKKLKETTLKDIKSKAFPDSGWYVMRKNKNYCLVSCGPNGQEGRGGHCHNDKLSFELMINNKDVIVDPGTYVYTAYSEWRNKFRSTAFHNTIVIDNQEQNRLVGNELFLLKNDARTKILEWKTNQKYDNLNVEHIGYARFKDPVVHRRKLIFNKDSGSLIIKDTLAAKKRHIAKINFNLSPYLKKKEIIIENNKIQLRQSPGYYSSFYGKKIITKRTEGDLEIKNKTHFETKIKRV